MLCSTLLFCLLLVAYSAVAQETEERKSRLVLIDQGPVRGYKDSVNDFYSFYNIPYATAPTGADRFKAPLPPPRWIEPLDAVNRGIICPQVGGINSFAGKTVQEDCLVANVHVPDTNAKDLPVVVYVHGGAFQSGFGDTFKPVNLIQNKNIIVVTFNYRVGIHGFLCLGTKSVPGNAGMKDQVALLRWVKENIDKFGGNPHSVTIFGCSAGSAAVDLLMLSKATHGLFGKVITGSGASLCPFTVEVDPLETARKYLISLNVTHINPRNIFAVEEYYKTTPLESLLLDKFVERKDSGVTFSPCVERFLGNEMFLDEAPIDILRKSTYRKVPVMYGFTDMEGLTRLNYFEIWKDDMNEKFSDFLPINLHFPSKYEKEDVARSVKEFYFGNQPISEDNFLSFLNYFTDVVFSYGVLSTVKFHVDNGHHEVYLYEYSFVDDNSELIPHTNVRGAGHCSQESALVDEFGIWNKDESGISEEYKNIREMVTELWSNFIKTGEPAPKNSSLPMWLPVGANRSPHMSLGQTVELKGPLLEESAHFWDNIFAKYHRVPQPPMSHHNYNHYHSHHHDHHQSHCC